MAPIIAVEGITEPVSSKDTMIIKPKGSPLILRTHTPEGNARAIAMLNSFDEGDETEQRETWELLKKALDEDRLSNRKLFP